MENVEREALIRAAWHSARDGRQTQITYAAWRADLLALAALYEPAQAEDAKDPAVAIERLAAERVRIELMFATLRRRERAAGLG